MGFDWKGLVKTVAPAIGTALGGPLGGMASKAVAGALLGDENATEEDIAAAVAGASPDQLLALKKADQDFQARMKELDIDVEKIHQQDRDSAREREVKTGDSATPRLLAIGVTLGFFGILGAMLYGILPEKGSEPLLIMLGALGTSFTGVIQYYFGSSAGSKEKTAALSAGRK